MKNILVGTLPPPVHGMAVIFESLVNILNENRAAIEVFDVSPRRSGRGAGSKFARLARYFELWKSLVVRNKSSFSQGYIALSGGWGQIFDLVSVILFRAKRFRVILHHHSFAYLSQRKLLTRLLFVSSGSDTLHVALGETMALALKEQYNIDRQHTLTLSNIAFFEENSSASPRSKLRTIGFISNLVLEKGIDTVIDLAEEVKRRNLPVEITVAGPCENEDVRLQVEGAVKQGLISWLGPVHGLKKQEFFNGIDLMLFPSRYKNEAEPVVIWESLCCGIPVVAFDRGCIKDQLGDTGVVVEKNHNFVDAAADMISLCCGNDERFTKMSADSIHRFREKRIESKRQLDSLLERFA